MFSISLSKAKDNEILGMSAFAENSRRGNFDSFDLLGWIQLGGSHSHKHHLRALHVKKASKRRMHQSYQFAKKVMHILMNFVSCHNCRDTLAQHFDLGVAITQSVEK